MPNETSPIQVGDRFRVRNHGTSRWRGLIVTIARPHDTAANGWYSRGWYDDNQELWTRGEDLLDPVQFDRLGSSDRVFRVNEWVLLPDGTPGQILEIDRDGAFVVLDPVMGPVRLLGAGLRPGS